MPNTQVLHASSNGSETRERSRKTLLVLLIALGVPALSLLIGLIHLRDSWDDGAITAAFSRTLAVSGHLALTPVSQSVEGTSSLAWLVLLTVPGFFTANPDAFLVWMKICAAVCFAVSIPLFFRLALRMLGDWLQAIAVTLLLAFTVTPYHEAYNGMEMNLMLLLVIALTLVLTRAKLGTGEVVQASLLSAAILATRFESPFLLAFLLGALALKRERRRTIAVVASFALLAFLGFECWRYIEFHLWMPNTVYAKRFPPYQPPHTIWGLFRSRAIGVSEPFLVVIGPLLVLAVVCLRNRSKLSAVLRPLAFDEVVRFTAVMFVADVLFSLALGHNWGHVGRMVLGFLPFFLLLMMRFAAALTAETGFSRKRLFGWMLATQGVFWALMLLPKPHEPIPIHLFEPEGLFAKAVRTRLQQPVLHVLIPDVGGAALCCARLDIHDGALLTDPYLAMHGYRGMPAYFARVRPEMVIAHDPWGALDGLYTLPAFADYGVISWEGQTAFVRPDIYERLKMLGLSEVPVRDTPACQDEFFRPNPDDLRFAMRHTHCLILPADAGKT